MLVKVEVVMNVEFCEGEADPKPGDPLEDRVLDSVSEAVENALRHIQGDGFSHDMESILSVMVESVGDAERV
jgi:hypothetical protein